MEVDTAHLKALGSNTTKYAYDKPDASLLETFTNPAITPLNPAHASLFLNIEVPEFTSLCPLTGQPDFATIVIQYTPNELCVESKSLKLYLMGFRMSGEFHEACVTRIANDLIAALSPSYLKVEGRFTPRGGIPFWPTMIYHQDHD